MVRVRNWIIYNFIQSFRHQETESISFYKIDLKYVYKLDKNKISPTKR